MAGALRVKSGRPSEDLKNDPLLVQNFYNISAAIKRELKVDANEQILAEITYKLQLFMEEIMGKDADRENLTLVRLPRRLFRDFRENGSLFTILKIALAHMKPDEWEKYDVLNPANKSSMFDVLAEMDRRMQESGMMKYPIIYFSDTLSTQLVTELRDIATRHGATITQTLQEATHVVVWDDDVDGASPEDLAEDFIRPLELRPNQGHGLALVHWWYYPDSYDEWIPSAEVECKDVPEDPEEELHNMGKQWRVSCRFVRDVAVFNEWGNELDYEKEAEGEGDEVVSQEVSEVTASGGRRSRGKKGRADKQRRQEQAPILEAVQVTEKMMAYLPPPTDDPEFCNQMGDKGAVVVDVHGGNRFTLSVGTDAEDSHKNTENGDMEVVEGSDNSVGSKKRKEMDTVSSDAPDDDGSPVQKRKRQLLLDTKTPSGGPGGFPSWYSPQSISTVELRYLPEILAPALHLNAAACKVDAEGTHRGSEWVSAKESSCALHTKTSQRYITVRNFIVNLYSDNPDVYLTATECRQKIAGDAAYTMRVHEFLDAFDLINYSPNIKPTSRPQKSPAFFTSCPSVREIEDHCSAFRSAAKTLSSSGGQRKAAATDWTNEFDKVLLDVISSSVTVKEGSGERSVDWSKVSKDVASRISMAPSPQACFRRFVEMSLSAPLVEKNDPGISNAQLDPAYVHRKIVGGGGNGMALSKKLHSAAAVVASECASMLDYDAALSAVSAANLAIQAAGGSGEAAASVSDLLGGGAALVSAAADQALKGHAAAMGDILDDYLSLRMIAIEEKVKLVTEVEKCLEMERDRLKLDRRDLQVQRAELAFYQPY